MIVRAVDGATTEPRRELVVLFLSKKNAARSQIAEAILRRLSSGRITIVSAGARAHEIHPLAYSAVRGS